MTDQELAEVIRNQIARIKKREPGNVNRGIMRGKLDSFIVHILEHVTAHHNKSCYAVQMR